VIFSLVYLMPRRLLALIALLCRGDAAKEAELLALRHENEVLRRKLAGGGSSRPIGCDWRVCPVCCPGLLGRGCFR